MKEHWVIPSVPLVLLFLHTRGLQILIYVIDNVRDFRNHGPDPGHMLNIKQDNVMKKFFRLIKKAGHWYADQYIQIYKPVLEAGVNPFL